MKEVLEKNQELNEELEAVKQVGGLRPRESCGRTTSFCPSLELVVLLPQQKLKILQAASGRMICSSQASLVDSPDSPFDYIPPKVRERCVCGHACHGACLD